MTQRAAREDADEFTRNEGINATAALFRLFAKHGLSFGDMPEIQRQHAEYEAVKTRPARRHSPQATSPTRSSSCIMFCTNGSMSSRTNTSASRCGFSMRMSLIVLKSRRGWPCSARCAAAARPIC